MYVQQKMLFDAAKEDKCRKNIFALFANRIIAGWERMCQGAETIPS